MSFIQEHKRNTTILLSSVKFHLFSFQIPLIFILKSTLAEIDNDIVKNPFPVQVLFFQMFSWHDVDSCFNRNLTSQMKSTICFSNLSCSVLTYMHLLIKFCGYSSYAIDIPNPNYYFRLFGRVNLPLTVKTMQGSGVQALSGK